MAETIRQRARRVFMEVADLPPEERAAALLAASAGDEQLRAEVQALLDAEARAGGFMSAPTSGPEGLSPADAAMTAFAPTAAASVGERPGMRIGPYKLLQLIGEGGFGSVFMAEQERPVSRKVALKIIKLGMDTRQVIARFEAERQALAIMDHPNIARVLDAGATETGRPFFVMELVKGDPIVEYCDRNNLSIQDRLELFAQVCQAVQHAHTKGIIHRDIKPSNILVSTQDGRPHAKVIDFGIAKATATKLTEKTLFTEHRQLIGTPEYMSPEQAEGSLDIDTRTDVYSLGVLLYELLTGTTPFSSKELRSAAYAEIQRIIREVEPPKPSTRLSHNTDTLASVAAHRHTEPKRLGTIVRGELDWIVMKALEKDRQRRYETANGLGMDIKRYLAGEAVVAAPPSNTYRFKKFVKRNKGPVVAAGFVAAALVLGVVGTGYGLFRAERARADEAAQRVLAQEQEAEAKKQEGIASAVAKFQADMLAAVDPRQLPKDPVTGEPLKDAVTVVQAMAAAVKVLDEGSLTDQPLVEARVRGTIGNTLYGLARYAEAEPNLRKALALRRAALPAGHPDIASTLNKLALLLQDQNRLAEAEPLSREALEIRRAAHPEGTPDIGWSLNNLAEILQALNKLDEAEPLFREALEIYRAALPAGHPDIAVGLNNLAVHLQDQGKLAEAEPLFREALEINRASLPAGHPDIARCLDNLAKLLAAQNKRAEAEPLMREALEIRRAAFPAGHADIALGLSNLAGLLMGLNKLAEAEPLFREALEINRASLPAGHPAIAKNLNNLAVLLQNQGKLAEAEPLYREALEIRRAALPAGHPDIAQGLHNLASLLQAQNKLAEAETLFRESLAINRAALPAGHPDIARCLNNLGELLRIQNKLAEAEPLFREALRIFRAALPAGDPKMVLSLQRLATTCWQQGKLDQSIPMFEEALALLEKASGRQHRSTLKTVANLGVNYKDAGRLTDAIPLLEEAYRASKQEPSIAWVGSQLLDAYVKAADPAKPESIARVTTLMQELLADARAKLPKDSPDLAGKLAVFGQTLLTLKAWTEAEPLTREALEIRRAALPAGHPQLLEAKSNLAALYVEQGKSDEALPLLREVLESRRATLPKDSPELAGQLSMHCLALLELKAWDEAEELLRECLAIREKNQPDAWTTFNTRSMLGGALLGQNKLAEAELLLLEGYQGMKDREAAIPPQGQVRIPEALERLVKLYEAWDKAEPGKGYDAKAAQWKAKLDAAKAKPDAPSTPEKK